MSRRAALGLAFLAVALWYVVQQHALLIQIADARLPLGRDIGHYLQVLENIAAGRGSGSAILGVDSIFAEHFSPIYYIVAPIYLLLRAITTPLVAATALGGLSIALTLFLALRFVLRQAERPAMIALLGLLVIALANWSASFLFGQGPRDALFAAPALIVAIHGFETRRLHLFAAGFAVALACREDLSVIALGFALLSWRREWFWRLTPLVLAAVTLLLAWQTALAAGDGEGFAGAGRYSYLLAGPLQQMPALLLEALIRPVNLRFVFELLAAFAFLPLIRPRLLLVAAPYVALLCLNQSDVFIIQSIDGYYTSAAAPALLYSALHGWRALQNWLEQDGRPLAPLVVLLLLIGYYSYQSPLWRNAWPQRPAVAAAEEISAAKRIVALEGRPVFVPWQLAPYFADLPQTRWLSAESAAEWDQALLVAPANLSRPDLLPEFLDLGSYPDWLRSQLRAGRVRSGIVGSGGLLLIDRGAAPDDETRDMDRYKLPRLKYSFTVEAEYTLSENRMDRIDLGRSRRARRVSPLRGVGLPPRWSGMAIIIGPFRVRDLADLRINSSGDEFCPPDKTPELILQSADGNTHRRPIASIVRPSDSGSSAIFRDLPPGPTHLGIRSRGCGNLQIDKIEIRLSHAGVLPP